MLWKLLEGQFIDQNQKINVLFLCKSLELKQGRPHYGKLSSVRAFFLVIRKLLNNKDDLCMFSGTLCILAFKFCVHIYRLIF